MKDAKQKWKLQKKVALLLKKKIKFEKNSNKNNTPKHTILR